MVPSTYDPGFYVPQYLCSRFLGRTLFRNFTSVVLHFCLDPYSSNLLGNRPVALVQAQQQYNTLYTFETKQNSSS